MALRKLTGAQTAQADQNLAGMDEMIRAIESDVRDLLDDGEAADVDVVALVGGQALAACRMSTWDVDILLSSLLARALTLKIKAERS